MQRPKSYFNENDPKAARWIEELIKEGLIAAGDVDTRSIEDVTPMDVAGYTQCHFFAGIGGWSYALRLAGWEDTRRVWTGSCPCQPFSAAGKAGGFADERHLWPAWFHLISICKPPVIFGEQVASKDGLNWLDLVLADLEGAKHAVGVADLSAAGVGAPHIRQRIYFVADAGGERFEGPRLHLQLREPRLGDIEARRSRQARDGFCRACGASIPHRYGEGRCPECIYWLADSSSKGLEIGRLESARKEQPPAERSGDVGQLALAEGQQQHGSGDSGAGRGQSSNRGELGDTSSAGSGRDGGSLLGAEERFERSLWRQLDEPESASELGAWANAEFIPCTDGKARPIEPGTFPLVAGLSGRVGLLRGYGNAIVPQVAAQFIGSYLDADRSEFQ